MRLKATLTVNDRPILSVESIVDDMTVEEFINSPDYELQALAMQNCDIGTFHRIQNNMEKRKQFIDHLAQEFAMSLTAALDKRRHKD